MISHEVFAHWWNMLDEHFHGRRSQMQRDGYWNYLRPRLDDERFEAASRTIWAEDDHFPKPHRFVEAAPSLGVDHMLGEAEDYDPHEPTIIYVKRRSRAGRQMMAQFKRREEQEYIVESETPRPYPTKQNRDVHRGFPRPVVRFID